MVQVGGTWGGARTECRTAAGREQKHRSQSGTMEKKYFISCILRNSGGRGTAQADTGVTGGPQRATPGTLPGECCECG